MPASAYSSVRTAPPANWEAFENGTATLWGLILNDDGIQRFGRGGQEQYGIDVWGYKDKNPNHLVAIQCKCKGEGKQATAKELREDVEKALVQFPDMVEYYFTTTAPNHGPLQIEAHNITKEQAKAGRTVLVRTLGWGNLLEKIAAFPQAALAFDPAYSPFIEQLADRQSEENTRTQVAVSEVNNSVLHLDTKIDILLSRTDAVGVSSNSAEKHLDEEIDRYRAIANEGDPRVALGLFSALLVKLSGINSGHIWFRVKANIGHCHLSLDDRDLAITWLEDAVRHAPNDPKAVANSILAMMLRGDPEKAFKTAMAELNAGSDNDVVAAYAVQAAGLTGVVNALPLIPDHFRDSEGVRKYHLNNLRSANNAEWKVLARTGLRDFPDDSFYRRQAVDADIDDILEGQLRPGLKLTDEQCALLCAAAGELRSQWGQACKRGLGVRPENLALNINAAIALVAVGEGDEAKSLIREGLVVANGQDQDLLLRAGAIAFELDDMELADEVFSSMPMEGPGLLVRCQIAARKGNWPFLESLYGDDRLLTIPEGDREPIAALVETSEARRLAKKDKPGAKNLFSKLIDNHSGSPRALVLIAQGAREQQFSDLDDRAYIAALAALRPDSHFVDRATLAHHAMRKDDHRTVIKLLDGFIDLKVPSDELDALATAQAYSYPSLASGERFFADLAPSIREQEPFPVLEGLYQYHRGDLDSALERWERARQLSPDRLRYLLFVAQLHLRRRQRPAVVDLLKDLDLATITGSPGERMDLAHLLNLSGRRDDALLYGYETFRDNRNDPTVNLKFVGLTFANSRKLMELSEQPVAPGMWTRLTSADDQSREFLIVDGPSDPVHGHYDLTHSLAAGANGHVVGNTFEVVDDLRRTTTWTIQEVRHQYLHAHRDITENFEARFPDHGGFYVIRTQGDDIQPMLDVVKQQGERKERLLQSYGNWNVPIAVIVDMAGENQIAFADALRFHGLPIETCRGDHAERVQAIRHVEQWRNRGAVLDSLTHWAVVGMEAVDVLQAVFGDLYVAQSTSDDLTELVSNDAFDEEARSGTTYYKDGQFYYDESTPERIASREDAISRRLATLGEQFHILPASAPDDLDPGFSEHLSGGTLHPIFAAGTHSYLLISDDRSFRDWAQHLGASAAWLQPVFLYARAAGLIDNVRYAKLAASLALHSQLPVAVDAQAIVGAVQASSQTDCTELMALANCIGGEKAEMSSHAEVFIDAVALLWGDKPMLTNARSATSALMRNMMRYRPELKSEVLKLLEDTLTPFRGGREFFQRWKVGHFIVDDAAQQIILPRQTAGRQPNHRPRRRGGPYARGGR